MSYIPQESKHPHLQVPENRAMYAFKWFDENSDNPMIFAAFAYWIERCENDGSDY